jgi:hypothetical protein
MWWENLQPGSIMIGDDYYWHAVQHDVHSSVSSSSFTVGVRDHGGGGVFTVPSL